MIVIVSFCIISSILLVYVLRNQTSLHDAEHVYMYAYPLVLMDTTKKIMTRDGAYQNRFIHVAEFPTAAFKSIVRPNVDTLYSFAWLNLSQEPLILSVPDTDDRYYLIECLDAWTNVFCSIGKRTTGTKAQQFIIVGPDWHNDVPEGYTQIQAPTNMVLLLARTHTYGKKDYEAVHAIQAGYVLTPLSQKDIIQPEPMFIHAQEAGGILEQAPVTIVQEMDVVKFYTVFTKAFKENGPSIQDAPMVHILKKFGIEQGKDFDVSNESNVKILQDAIQPAFEKITAQKESMHLVNGWAVMLNIGTYGTDYLTRAFIAFLGIGANLPEDAVYPTTFVDADGNSLTGKNKYRIHFEPAQLPPVNAFWSLTLYNEESFLVDVPFTPLLDDPDRFAATVEHRYSLNNRDPLIFNEDGSLDIYIQRHPVLYFYGGKQIGESNWLPAPEGLFNLTLRLYWPKESVLDGSWKPPVVKKLQNK